MGRTRGRVAIVTSPGRGIGRASAAFMAQPVPEDRDCSGASPAGERSFGPALGRQARALTVTRGPPQVGYTRAHFAGQDPAAFPR